jgi:hypothetical protein
VDADNPASNYMVFAVRLNPTGVGGGSWNN